MIEVNEGRLDETATPDATGMERRAYGEFVSQRGELASYALGWRTDTEPPVGWVTVGIGVGNEGGGTFHAEAFFQDDVLGYRLVDEAFAEVPQGGPHLSAEQAKAHHDLEFIWAVVDVVFDRDRRAWWLRHWLRGTAAIQTPPVFDLSEPILLVQHDADDGIWQLIGTSDAGEDAKLAHLFHAIDADATLLDVLDLEPGERAERSEVGGEWTRSSAP
ncbi:hypothetical protein OJ997_33250 [Solirubrobacter phytolaccae]|uniref:Uncharacterized protein n=1 Tax=Solirubrobacter phytolaccae TaxID=1404360 RepID=A0A9X3NFH3_9ACTN|nr:hypothetical protein [Solirubrobacter phytolaccae]MDA0185219.1 hypothetical protein [Solirubrobacter phytolaccae]